MQEEKTTYPAFEVHAFDFDGTLTKCDSLLAFIRFSLGGKALAKNLLLMMPRLLLMKLRLYPNGKAKERLFRLCFGGMAVDKFDALCRRFAAEKTSMMRPKGIARIREVIESGGRPVIVSASIVNWVRPFFARLPDVTVIGTMAEERDGVLTGRFLTKNCYGEEKVNRLLQLYPERSEYRLTAYGDSRGDFALLDFADESHYKPF